MGKRSAHARTEQKIARDTPDEIEEMFDLSSETFREDFNRWGRSYQKLMRVKHGFDVELDMLHESVPMSESVRVVKLFVKKEAEDGPEAALSHA